MEGMILMKRNLLALALSAALVLSLTACGRTDGGASSDGSAQEDGVSALILSDDSVTLDGQIVTETGGTVSVGHEIVYYESGKGSDYGAGTADEEHSAEEAAEHTVVTVRKAGTYRVSGTLSKGQIAVDLGADAKTDPSAVVTLILDNVDVTCTVAPALIFYNVYECDTQWVAYDDSDSSEDYQAPSPTDVDTSAAGANIVLADGSTNNFTGSHVAKIYKEGTEKKLHKYDGAFYSKMSMNISAESAGTGVLNITGDNEGLDSELHLTINSGYLNIRSQDDGINTNEDGVSVTAINGGTVQINAGLGAEGDGIDSNGSIVINGGNVYTMANAQSPDGGLDADGDIIINGGFVAALGVRNDQVSQKSGQQYMELSFASSLPAGSAIKLTDPDGSELLAFTTEKACQSLIFSSDTLESGVDYTLTVNGVVQQYTGRQSGGFDGGRAPEGSDGQTPPELPDGQTPPEKPDGANGHTPPERPDEGQSGKQPPENGQKPPMDGRPDGQQDGGSTEQPSSLFTLSDSRHSFSGICDSQ